MMFSLQDGILSSTVAREISLTKRTKFSRVVCITFIAFLATACAAFPEYKIPKVDRIPASTKQKSDKPSVYIPLKIMIDFSNWSHDNTEYTAPLPKLRQIVEESANEAALFKSTTFESFQAKNADNVLHIEITRYEAGFTGMNLITGLTLFVIPSKIVTNYKLTANLFDGDVQLLKTYSYEDTVTIWQGIWLIPMAGNTLSSAEFSIWENMIRTLFLDIRKDGLLTKDAKKQERAFE